jgi:CotH kinase protein/Chitobiase/beta-hexosaminidase C-terminal domain/Lectin C-type domain/Secretion system C-terminal sorting domain/HYR domain/F5/8 type C domain/Divergent InlB B-repeat domain
MSPFSIPFPQMKRQIWSITLTFYGITALAQAVVTPPVASVAGGRFNAPVSVSLLTPTAGATIYYTLNGSDPTTASSVYQAPINISAATPLRAKAFAAGMTASKTTTHTYLFNVSHTFPIVALSFNNSDFFHSDTGLYTQYLVPREVKLNVELFEPNQSASAFSLPLAAEIQGSTSAQLPQKSLEIKAKASAGSATVPYTLFPDLPYTSYKRFVLHNSGQDWGVTQFRDALVSGIFRETQDLNGFLRKPETHMQGFRPAVVYFNGLYWGIHNLRERMTGHYIEQHFGWTGSQYDLVENDLSLLEIKNGDSIAWFQFRNEVIGNVLSPTPNQYASDASIADLSNKMDMQNFIDYTIINLYMDNQDWLTNNMRRFKFRNATDKWKWLCFDFDFTMGLFTPAGWNTGDATQNTLERMRNLGKIAPNYNGAPEAVLFEKCWQNPGFRRRFINRLADMMNSAFTPSRLVGRVEQFKTLYEPEINKHAQRWGTPFYPNVWDANLQHMRNFSNARQNIVYNHFLQDDILRTQTTSVNQLVLQVSPANSGTLQLNTLTLAGSRLPFVGKYFNNTRIPLKAIPAPGYEFVGWSDPAYTGDSVNIVLFGPLVLTANFRATTACTPDVTNLNSTTCNPALVGTTTVVLRNIRGCDSTVITTRTLQALAQPIITPSGNTLTTNAASSYQWFLNDVSISGATNQRFTATVTGQYKVEIVNAEGCRASSNNLAVTVTPTWNCPAILKNFGDPCDDGNSLTINDIIQSDCTCRGTFSGAGVTLQCPANITLAATAGAIGAVATWNTPATATNCLAACNGAPTAGFTFIGRVGNREYYVSTTATTWANAKTACQAAGGNLAVITTLEQNTVIRAGINPANAAFIGLSSPITAGDFRWVDGSPLTFSRWDAGQPFIDPSVRRDYVMIQGWNGLWTTGTHQVVKPFVLEKVCNNGILLTQTAGLPSGSLFPIGQNTITYQAKDACGAQQTCSFQVNVSGANASCAFPTNVSFLKSATFSSTYYAEVGAPNLLDGDLTDIARTTRESSAWLEIDLGAIYNTTEIKIYNRPNCCSEVLSNYYVLVSETPFVSPVLATVLAQPEVWSQLQPTNVGSPTTITTNRRGRYVRVQRTVFGQINLAEIQVFGCAAAVNPIFANNRRDVLQFEPYSQRGESVLMWLNNTHAENEEYIIERSPNGVVYERLFNVPSPTDTAQTLLVFTERDKFPLEGDNFYRLTVRRRDGSVVASPVRRLNFSFEGQFSVAPNPTEGALSIHMKLFNNKSVELRVYNTIGEAVYSEKINEVNTPIKLLNLSNLQLQNGMYMLTVVENGRAFTRRFVLMK